MPLVNQLQKHIDQIPFASILNAAVVEAKLGFVNVLVKPRPELFNHFGTFQAGVYYTLLEITGGLLCATFFNLTENLLITKSSEIQFLDATNEELLAQSSLDEQTMEIILSEIYLKKKTTVKIGVVIKSVSGKMIAEGTNFYYLRLGIPKVFTINRKRQ